MPIRSQDRSDPSCERQVSLLHMDAVIGANIFSRNINRGKCSTKSHLQAADPANRHARSFASMVSLVRPSGPSLISITLLTSA
jgi:hypothetical protein